MGTSNTECYGQIQGHGSRRAPVVFVVQYQNDPFYWRVKELTLNLVPLLGEGCPF